MAIEPEVRQRVIEAAQRLQATDGEISLVEINRLLADRIPGWPGDESSYGRLKYYLQQSSNMDEVRALLLGLMAIGHVRSDPSSERVADWWQAERKLRQMLKQARQRSLLHGNNGRV
jgi:hypothetical protein